MLSTVVACTPFLMAAASRVNGRSRSFTEWACTAGRAGVNTKAIMLKTRNMDLVFSFGLMGSIMKVIGMMVNRMALGVSRAKTAKQKTLGGKMVSVYGNSGLIKQLEFTAAPGDMMGNIFCHAFAHYR